MYSYQFLLMSRSSKNNQKIILIHLRWHVFQFMTLERHQFRYTQKINQLNKSLRSLYYRILYTQFRISKIGEISRVRKKLAAKCLYIFQWTVCEGTRMHSDVAWNYMLIWTFQKIKKQLSQNTFHLFHSFSNLTFKSQPDNDKTASHNGKKNLHHE